MNRKRAYLLFTLSAVLALSSCSGIKQTSGGGGTATFSATFTDTIPANTNISITNFVVTVTGFTLDPTTGSPVSLLNGPGNIPLVAPTFDLARLHADDILFGVTSVPTGTYVSITLTVSNPVITFFNQTGTTISGCANGTVCKIAVAASGSIKVSTSPFPLTLTNSQKTGVRLDFNFANALTLTAGTLGVDFTQANVLSAAVLAVLGLWLSETAFGEWGWRVAFLASGLLIGVGIWMRTRVAESPLYRAYAERRARTDGRPLALTLLEHWKAVLTVFLVKAAENALFYVFTTFFIVYVTRVLHRPRTLALEAAAVGSIADVAAIFAAGALSDRFGRLPITGLGLIGAAAWSFILFPATTSGATPAIMMAAAIGGVCHGVIVGGMSPFFVELFPMSARYTGFSLGYQVATVFTGALAPLIGVALLNQYGSTLPVSLYAAAMTAPGLTVLGMAPETRGRDLA